MAEKLSIIVALEGGKEIERQLEGIGEAGQKAFDDIAKSAEAVGGFKNLKPEEVTAKLNQLGIAGTAAFDKIKSAVSNASRMESVVVAIQGIENGLAKAGKAAIALVAALGPVGAVAIEVGKKILDSMTAASKAINAVNDAALKMGVSITKLDELRLSFENAGVSAKGLEDAITRVQGQFDKFQAGKIKTALSELEDAAKRGFGAQGTEQLKILEEAAKGTGKAAEDARAALEKLGLPVPESAAEAIKQLGEDSKTAAEFAQDLKIKLAEMPPGLERDALAIQNFGVEFARGLNAGTITVDTLNSKLTALSEDQAKAAAQLEAAQNRVAAGWQRLLADPSWEKFTNFIGTLFDKAFNQNLGIWDTLKKAGVATWNAITDAAQATVGVVNSLIEAIGNAINKLLQLLGIGQQVGGGSSGENPVTAPQGFAGGGPVGGRGSGTSDSNLAWVSRGEHIMPARAVSQPGVLAFLEALRRSGGNLARVLDGMGRFALGGPVAIPSFAGGGLAGGSRDLGTLTLGLPSGGSVTVRASSSVVDQLRKEATLAQVRSGGRKPSRYR